MATDQSIKEEVRHHYGRLAAMLNDQETGCCQSTSSCCGEGTGSKATRSGLYSLGDLGNLPADIAEASWGSGNPVAFADLRPGEVVLDLGSGGGLDSLLAARKVAPHGHVIGVDMTPEMLSLAWKNAAAAGISNVEFRKGELEALPLPDASVDVIISNCVINLSPDKDKVFAEAYRVLRPGGRFVVSDVVLLQDLPEDARQSSRVWCECVAGALRDEEFLFKAEQAGFIDVHIVPEGSKPYISGLARSVLVKGRKAGG
jgi:SAM-dependent methyltransferase